MKPFRPLLSLKLAVLPLLLAAASALAFEGRVEMQMISKGDTAKPMEIAYRIKDTRMRTEFTPPPDKKGRPASGPAMAMIVDWKKSESYTLMPEQKMYMVTKLTGLTEMANEQAAKNGQQPFDFKPTGRKEKIAGIEAVEYAGKSDGKWTEMWVTKELGKFMMSGPGAKRSATPSEMEKFMTQENAFMLRMVQRKKENGPEEIRMEATKVEKSAQPDSLFVPPADYQRFETPSLGDMMKGLIPGGGR